MNINKAQFKVNGKTYSICRNRYLQSEFNRIKSENHALSGDEEKSFAILQDKYARLEKLAVRVKELEDKYYENFDDNAGELYNKALAQYNKVFEETAAYEITQSGIANKAQKNALDNAEKTVIAGLQIDNDGKTIRTYEEAHDIWCSFVDEVGQSVASEWLVYFLQYLMGNDNVEDDPFVAQAKARAEQKANMKKGLKLTK